MAEKTKPARAKAKLPYARQEDASWVLYAVELREDGTYALKEERRGSRIEVLARWRIAMERASP